MLTEQGLDKLAHAVVDRFTNEKTALTDGVVDAAQQENLNPEQIKRLVESVNNLTFLQKFNNTPAGQDRMIEFEPASADAAIQRLLANAKEDATPVDTTEAAGLGALPFTRAGEDKTAAWELNNDASNGNSDPLLEKEGREHVQHAVTILRLRKTAEHLEEEKHQHRYALRDSVDALVQDFKRTGGENFEAFEQDALYKWGAEACPFLQTVRIALNKDMANYNPEAATKLARVIDSRTPAMQHMSAALEHFAAIQEREQGLRKVAEYTASAEKALKAACA
jgi:hypothetical protein